MNPLKKLAGQTAIYGTSSIIGRLLNYLLIPIYARLFAPQESAVFVEMYAYVSFLAVILTYGMETAFFRFNENETNKDKVYSTTLISLFVSSALFIIITVLFSQQLANLIQYPKHKEYIIWFAIIIAIDAFTSIPFAKLRAENKAKKFALYKIINIIVSIGLNLLFLLLLPLLYKVEFLKDIVSTIYNPKIGIGYIFISNLLSSIVMVILFIPSFRKIKIKFDKELWKKMFKYAYPLLFLGLAGIVNENIDRLLLKYLLPKGINMIQVGIYGMCYKISIIMTIFIQAFRYAAEPFFFSHAKNLDAKIMYAQIMKYFVIICSLIFLGTMLYMDFIKHFVSRAYFSGIKVVPILLLANMFLGIFYNLSIWYKLTGQTKFGAYLSIAGAGITVVLNLILIPHFGYMGSAWTTLICYLFMMIASYYFGQKYYPVRYNVRKILLYILSAIALYWISELLKANYLWLRIIFNTFLLSLFVILIIYLEKTQFDKLIKNFRK